MGDDYKQVQHSVLPNNPNRDYIRKVKKALNLQGRSTEEIRQIITILKEKERLEAAQKFQRTTDFLNDGDKIRLKIDAIKAHPDYPKKTEKFRNFVDGNAGKIFTVVHDERHKDWHTIVCLKEDTSDPKWLWYESHLELVERVQ